MPDRSLPLMELFEAYYRPARLPTAGCHEVCRYRTSIRKLAACIGREPTIGDLVPDTGARYVDYLAELPINYGLRLGMRTRLGRLWQYGHDLGLVDEPPALPRFVERRRRRELPPAPAGSLRAFFEDDYLAQAGRSLAEETRHIYRRALTRLHEAFGMDVPLAECDAAMLGQHEAWLKAKGARPAAAEFESRLLRTLIRAAGRQDLAPYVGARYRRHRPPSREVARWTVDDVRRVYAAAAGATGPELPRCTPPEFWRAMILLTWWTGARHGRLLSLRCEDLDLAAGVVTIGKRRFRLPTDVIEALAPILANGSGELFAWDYHRKTFRKHAERIVAAAGIRAPTLKDVQRSPNDIHFDSIRRAGATHIGAAVGYDDGRLVTGSDGYSLCSGYRLGIQREPIVDAACWLPPLLADNRPPLDFRRRSIEAAAELLDAGDMAGAVLTINIAVDALLRKLCRLHAVRPGKPCTVPMANALAASGLIEPSTAKVLAWLVDLRCRAIAKAWKKQRPVTPDEAAQAIAHASHFLEQFAG